MRPWFISWLSVFAARSASDTSSAPGSAARRPRARARQVERLRALAASSGLDPDFAEKFLGFMVREVIRHHEDIKAEYDEVSQL